MIKVQCVRAWNSPKKKNSKEMKTEYVEQFLWWSYAVLSVWVLWLIPFSEMAAKLKAVAYSSAQSTGLPSCVKASPSPLLSGKATTSLGTAKWWVWLLSQGFWGHRNLSSPSRGNTVTQHLLSSSGSPHPKAFSGDASSLMGGLEAAILWGSTG